VNAEKRDTLLIRTDASNRIGTGHVMRCLALAQEWQRVKGAVLFAMAETTSALEQRLLREGIEVVLLPEKPGSCADTVKTAALAGQYGAVWVVADGYAFGSDWQQRIKKSGSRLLIWDDYGHAEHYYADFVLNQNLSADAEVYTQREPYTELLLGPRYAMLRREFLEWRKWQREIPVVARKVLVTLGGSDPENVTGKVIEALRRLPDLEATVVVGGSNSNLRRLEMSLVDCESAIKLVVDAQNMPELMAWADMAVTGGGSTCWETSFFGLPSCVIVLAENQAASVRRLREVGAIRCAGQAAETGVENLCQSIYGLAGDLQARKNLSERGRSLVDGRGVNRVVANLRGNLELET